MRRVSQIYDEALAPCGLGPTQKSVLNSIARAGRPTMGEPAVSLVLDRSALAHNIKPLKREGLIEVVADESTTSAILGCADQGRSREARPVHTYLGGSPTPFRERVRRGEGEGGSSNIGLHCLAGVCPSARLQIIGALVGRCHVPTRPARREVCRRVSPASTRASARSRMSSEMLPPVSSA